MNKNYVKQKSTDQKQNKMLHMIITICSVMALCCVVIMYVLVAANNKAAHIAALPEQNRQLALLYANVINNHLPPESITSVSGYTCDGSSNDNFGYHSTFCHTKFITNITSKDAVEILSRNGWKRWYNDSSYYLDAKFVNEKVSPNTQLRNDIKSGYVTLRNCDLDSESYVPLKSTNTVALTCSWLYSDYIKEIDEHLD